MALPKKPAYLDPDDIEFAKNYGNFWYFTQNDAAQVRQVNVRIPPEWDNLLADFAEQVGLNKAQMVRALVYDGLLVYTHLADRHGALPEELLDKVKDAAQAAEIDAQHRKRQHLLGQLSETTQALTTLRSGTAMEEYINPWRIRLTHARPAERAMIEEALGEWL